MKHATTRHVVGCMTGTSLDGLDAALVAIEGHGLEAQPRYLGMVSRSLDSVRPALTALAQGKPLMPLHILRASRQLGELHAQAVTDLLCDHLPAGQTAAFVVAHGQTIWHAPGEHLSWQLMDPWPVVRRLGLAVLYDLRQADLIAGGQGAPITPLADWMMFRHETTPRVIVNLGGICNITRLPAGASPETIAGSDIGPCNLLIDGLVQRLFPGQPFDRDGRIAAQGKVHPALRDWITEASFFKRPLPRTTGREDFSAAWVDTILLRTRKLGWSPADIVASAVHAVAALLPPLLIPNAHGWEAREKDSRDTSGGGGTSGEVVLAGGGAHHPGLVAALREAVGPRWSVILSDALGVPVGGREAAALAVLGALSRDGVPITCPAITGAARPGLAGAWASP